ncbi:MAG: hypothetical protein ACHQQS_02880 [Thermoanaerobaculales bacterium]
MMSTLREQLASAEQAAAEAEAKLNERREAVAELERRRDLLKEQLVSLRAERASGARQLAQGARGSGKVAALDAGIQLATAEAEGVAALLGEAEAAKTEAANLASDARRDANRAQQRWQREELTKRADAEVGAIIEAFGALAASQAKLAATIAELLMLDPRGAEQLLAPLVVDRHTTERSPIAAALRRRGWRDVPPPAGHWRANCLCPAMLPPAEPTPGA